MEPGTFSRALPRYFEHPRRYPTISPSDFNAMQKEQVEAAPAACPGHAGTRIWYFEQPDRRGYIVEVMFQSSESVYVQTPCTFTPTFCMDRIDGMLAQDAEEWVLSNRVGFATTRMNIFGDADRMESLQYLADRGLPEQLQNVMTLSGLPEPRPEFVVNPPAAE